MQLARAPDKERVRVRVTLSQYHREGGGVRVVKLRLGKEQ